MDLSLPYKLLQQLLVQSLLQLMLPTALSSSIAVVSTMSQPAPPPALTTPFLLLDTEIYLELIIG